MAISRMQNPQQLQGIGSLRQPYGLGKLVKKAFKGVKKVFKSPLGKAAILGGLGMWGMGAGPFTPGKFGAGFLKGIGKGGIGKFFKGGLKYLNPMSGAFGEKNKWKHALGLAGAGMIAAPFIQKKLGYGPYQDEEVEEDDWTVTPSSISNILSMTRKQDPSLNFLPSSAYTQSGFYGADGGIVGLANGGNPGEAQMEQMLRAEYLKYRNKGGTMPYEQFKILIMKQAQQGQMPNQMMAQGGRIGYKGGGNGNRYSYLTNKINKGISLTPDEEAELQMLEITYVDVDRDPSAQGGRIGYLNGEMVEQGTELIEGPQGGEEFQETVVEGQEQPSREQLEALAMEIFQLPLEELDEQQLLVVYQEAMQGQPMEEAVQEEDVQFAANGGIMGDDDEDVLNQSKAMSMYRRRRQEGGLMDLQGQEKDYRDEGGFVPLGGEERADDVPARLSKNEFVFTADAVRAAGGGDIDAGSEVMQNVMDNLEQGGEVSEDSQGLGGREEIMSEEIIDESNPAQGMYDNYEQLKSRVA